MKDILVIGGSAGALEPLLQLLKAIPAEARASVFVAIHGSGASVLPDIIRRASALPTGLAADGTRFKRGNIYVARPDLHLTLHNHGGTMRVFRGPRENGFRPSVDALFKSAARAFGERVIGVVLSGALDCGSIGLDTIQALGGTALVQDPREAQFPEMPQNAAKVAGAEALPVAALAARIVALLKGAPVRSRPHGRLKLAGRRETRPLSEMTCPECHGTLLETRPEVAAEFSCHVGHTYSTGGLAAQAAEDLERTLWTAVRALRENASLARRLGHSSRSRALGHVGDLVQDHLTGRGLVYQEAGAGPSLPQPESARLHKQAPDLKAQLRSRRR